MPKPPRKPETHQDEPQGGRQGGRGPAERPPGQGQFHEEPEGKYPPDEFDKVTEAEQNEQEREE